MNIDQLVHILPRSMQRAVLFIGPLNDAMAEFQINTPARQASFLAQVGHESSHLCATVENFNYGAERLQVVFPKYFPTRETAEAYARQPMRIASRVYALRMGNGGEGTRDGWNYRGRGLIQITGKDAYTACGQALGCDLLANPQFLEAPPLAARSAAWWWKAHGCNELADAGDQVRVTRRVNGGTNGLAERLALFAVAQRVLA